MFLLTIGFVVLLSTKVATILLVKQFISILIGIVLILVVSRLNIINTSSILFVFGSILLFLTLIVGSRINGAKRWISLPFFALQPSEIVKPSLIVLNAFYICTRRYIKSIFLITLIVTILILQPDFGSSIILLLSIFTQIIIISFSIKIALFIFASILSLSLIGYIFLSHIYARLIAFISNSSDIFGINFQSTRSLNAIHNGGLFGVGYGNGIVKDILPDCHTDFIISVIAEEMGIITIIVIYIAYLIILTRSLIIAVNTKDKILTIAATGIVSQIMIQILIHIYTATKMMPPKGTTLPFISYGGSSIIGSCIAIGMVLSLKKSNNLISILIEKQK